ncbi:MAG: glycosyltransferase [Flavobacteriales bacterium]|nr:glycosyltransferase [Flavobacteriales bacterium]
MSKNSVVVIFSPSKDAYSETFIQAHRNLNDGKILFIHGPITNLKLDDGTNLSNKWLKYFLRFVGILLRGSLKLDVKHEINRLQSKYRIKGVLIEYGTHSAHVIPYLTKYKVPIVTHFHGFDASMHGTIRTFGEVYRKLVFKHSDFVVGVSKRMCEELRVLGCPDNKLIYNVYGPNPSFLEIEPTYYSKRLFAVGRFVDKKAPYYLVLMMKKVVEIYPDVVLEIAGDGPLKDACMNMVKYFGLSSNVIFLGKTSPDEIVNKMTVASIFVQHSITPSSGDMEGTPLSILEASAAGLPIVSTRHAGIPDVVIHGETGYLCEEHNVDDMAKFVVQLLNNPEKIQQTGQKGKERIKETFQQDRHLSVLDSFFN